MPVFGGQWKLKAPGGKSSKIQTPSTRENSSLKEPHRKLLPPFGRLRGVLVHAVEPAAPLDLPKIKHITISKRLIFR